MYSEAAAPYTFQFARQATSVIVIVSLLLCSQIVYRLYLHRWIKIVQIWRGNFIAHNNITSLVFFRNRFGLIIMLILLFCTMIVIILEIPDLSFMVKLVILIISLNGHNNQFFHRMLQENNIEPALQTLENENEEQEDGEH